jgi:hypothetical protein
MCKISDKIKFCTCLGNIEKLKHSWTLYRYKREHMHIGGLIVMPAFIDPNTDAHNITTLEKRLNEPDAFDIQLAPKERDRLEITFTTGENFSSPLSYCFAYRKGKWVKVDHDSFDLMSRFIEIKSGKIKPALNVKKA